MRIICGTDFSAHAMEAATVAARMAARLNESLVLMHVVLESNEAPAELGSAHSGTEEARARLRLEAERLRKLGPPAVIEELASGSAYARLAEAGGREHTRCVVVSSLGWIAPSRFLLGSVAERTAEHSAAPTLVVRGSAFFEEWMRGERPLRVLVGYDFSATADSALEWIQELRRVGRCEVTVAHIDWPPQENERIGGSERETTARNSAAVQAVLERDLKAKVLPILGDEKVDVRVIDSWGRADLPLIDLARELKSDLIVVGTHQRQGLSRFWLGSVSRAVLHHSPVSVAVVPRLKQLEPKSNVFAEIKRILVPTDFSELANRAIPYAYSMLPRGGEVFLVHVAPSAKSKRIGLDALKRRLRRLIPEGAELRGIKTNLEIIQHSDPAKAICQGAERYGADVICMTTHGRSGLARKIFGSVAQAVSKRSVRPLLLLRAGKIA